MFGLEIDNLLENLYKNNNYKIEINEKAKNNYAVIYFSSNGIYYPNEIDIVKEKLVAKDTYEWYKSRIYNAKKHIFVRDIYKNFYVTGINERINSIDCLLEFLKQETAGMEIITVGSSAGGYMAVLMGLILNAKQIFAFSPIINIYKNFENEEIPQGYELLYKFQNDENHSKYYDISNLINSATNTSINYIYPKFSKLDLKHKSFVENKDINFIEVLSEEHGASFGRKANIALLNSDCKFIKKISNLSQKTKSKKLIKNILKLNYYLKLFTNFIFFSFK